METFTELFGSLFLFIYHCFDRVVIHGFGRISRGEYVQSLGQARGSNSEIETQLVIGRRIGIGVDPEFRTAQSLNSEVGKLLNGLIKSLRSSTGSRPRDLGIRESGDVSADSRWLLLECSTTRPSHAGPLKWLRRVSAQPEQACISARLFAQASSC